MRPQAVKSDDLKYDPDPEWKTGPSTATAHAAMAQGTDVFLPKELLCIINDETDVHKTKLCFKGEYGELFQLCDPTNPDCSEEVEASERRCTRNLTPFFPFLKDPRPGG